MANIRIVWILALVHQWNRLESSDSLLIPWEETRVVTLSADLLTFVQALLRPGSPRLCLISQSNGTLMVPADWWESGKFPQTFSLGRRYKSHSPLLTVDALVSQVRGSVSDLHSAHFRSLVICEWNFFPLWAQWRRSSSPPAKTDASFYR